MEIKLNHIYCDNALEILKKFPDEFVDCVITSPPYWALRDYQLEPQIWDGDEKCQHQWQLEITKKPNSSGGKGNMQVCSLCGAWRGSLGLEPTFELYLKHLLQIFDEIKRVLKKTGTLWINIGDTYAGSGSGTNDYRTEASKSIQGKGKYADRVYQGVGSATMSAKAKHHEDNRHEPRGKTREVPAKSLCLIPQRFVIGMVDRGWIDRNIIVWHKCNCMPSSAKDRFTVDYEPIFFFVKNKKYWFEQQYEPVQECSIARLKRAVSNKNKYILGAPGQSSQRISQSRPNRNYKGAGSRGRQENLAISTHIFNDGDYLVAPFNPLKGRNMRTVWDIPTQPFKDAHFAVFPEALVEPMIKAGCPEFICKKCGRAKQKIIETNNPSGVIEEEPRTMACLGFGSRQSVRSLHRNKGGVYPSGIFKGYTDCGCNARFEGGIVLDPFMGAGTTAVVAKKLGRQFIGIELNPKYVEMANKRIEKECGSLF